MNDGTKETPFLRFEDGTAIAGHVLYAFCIARDPNVFFTLHCAKAGWTRATAHAHVTAFFKHETDWLRQRCGLAPCRVVVWENPPPDKHGFGGGLNLHSLAHYPPELWRDLRRLARGWLTASEGRNLPDVLDFKHVAHHDGDLVSYLKSEFGLFHRLGYMLKGMDAASCERFEREYGGISIPCKDQGLIMGRRWSATNILRPGQRKWPIREYRACVRVAGSGLCKLYLLSLFMANPDKLVGWPSK